MGLKIIHHRSCEAAATEAGRALARRIALARRPLLLLSGGSSLNAVTVMLSRLSDKQKARLTIGQLDERISRGDGHGLNWNQIKKIFSGHLKLDEENAIINNGNQPNDMAVNYSVKLNEMLKQADVSMGVYGIGRDGSIAGMLPGQAAYQFTRFLDGRHVVKYVPKDYARVTTTAEVLVSLKRVYVLACGKDKHRAIRDLDDEILPYQHPAQLLKDARRARAYVHVGR